MTAPRSQLPPDFDHSGWAQRVSAPWRSRLAGVLFSTVRIAVGIALAYAFLMLFVWVMVHGLSSLQGGH